MLVKKLQEKIQPMIVPAILEHEEIQGITSRGRMGSLSRDLDSPVTNYKPSDLLAELTNHHKVY